MKLQGHGDMPEGEIDIVELACIRGAGIGNYPGPHVTSCMGLF